MKYIEQINLKNPVATFPNIIISSIYEICKQVNSDITEKDVVTCLTISLSSSINDSFYWDETEEGDEFWNNILRNKDFSLFFKEYEVKKGTCWVHNYHYTLLKKPNLPTKLVLAFNNHLGKKYKGHYFNSDFTVSNLTGRVYLCPCCGKPI